MNKLYEILPNYIDESTLPFGGDVGRFNRDIFELIVKWKMKYGPYYTVPT